MQCKSDAIKMQERAWGKNPGTMPTYLSSQALSNRLKWQWQWQWHWQRGGGGGEGGGGERSPRRIKQSVSEASLAPPRIKTSVRGLVKQQQDNATGSHAKSLETRQNASQRSHFPFQSNPYTLYSMMLPKAILSACWAVWAVRILTCQHTAVGMFPCLPDDYSAHKTQIASIRLFAGCCFGTHRPLLSGCPSRPPI